MIFGKAYDITPNDSANLPKPIQGLYVGAAGVVVFDGMDGVQSHLVGCLAGTIYYIAMRKIWNSGTSAGSLVGLTDPGAF